MLNHAVELNGDSMTRVLLAIVLLAAQTAARPAAQRVGERPPNIWPPRRAPCCSPTPPPWLFNLDHDPSEQFNVARDHPETVADLRRLAEEHKRSVVPVEDQIAKRAAAPAAR